MSVHVYEHIAVIVKDGSFEALSIAYIIDFMMSNFGLERTFSSFNQFSNS